MMNRTTITLEPTNLAFLNAVSGKNRSQYVNDLITQERKRSLAARMEKANLEEAEYLALEEEAQGWDATLLDGLE